MAALDTNVLVRHLVQDDHAQSAQVNALLQKCVNEGVQLFVPVTVLLELEWVLRTKYGFGKGTVMQVLVDLLSTIELVFESERALESALMMFREGAADFADCLHIALAAQAGAGPLWTLDKKAGKVIGAQLLT